VGLVGTELFNRYPIVRGLDMGGGRELLINATNCLVRKGTLRKRRVHKDASRISGVGEIKRALNWGEGGVR